MPAQGRTATLPVRSTARKAAGPLRPGLALAVLAAALACGAPAAAPPAASQTLSVREPRAVLTPDGGAIYFTVVNPGPADRLLRVETAMARAAEAHESVEEGGVVRMMARPEGFEVPAGGTLTLAPGGKHVMLVEPRVPAAAPGEMPLTLRFERAGAVEVRAQVSRVGGMDMDHAGHDMDSGPAIDHGDHAMEHEGMHHP